MKTIILLILLILILSLQILNLYFKNNIDNFISINNDPLYDGKMNFNYLLDPDYSKNILKKYYLNDDAKTNNRRNVYHPYQIKKSEYYGNPKFLYKNGTRIISDDIYNIYGIRV